MSENPGHIILPGDGVKNEKPPVITTDATPYGGSVDERNPSGNRHEEAKRCPRCGIPGEVVSTTPLPVGQARPGTRIETVFCRTEGCRWFGTSWVIQLNPDGSIPERTTNGPKQFPKMRDGETLERAINEQLEKQQYLETQPGGAESSNRRGRFGF